MKLDMLKTDGSNADFHKLTTLLDCELSQRYEELQRQYDPSITKPTRCRW